MLTFDFEFNSVVLEVFPKQIWENPYHVFHGTSAFHSKQIESRGFIKGYCPFDETQARKLISILSMEFIQDCDQVLTSSWARSKFELEYYLSNIRLWRLSF